VVAWYDTHGGGMVTATGAAGGDPSTRTVWITGLPQHVTEDAIRERFGQYGNITKVSIPRDSMTQMLKGFAFVEYDVRDVVWFSNSLML